MAVGVIVILLVILLVGLLGRPLASAGVLLSCTGLQGLMGLELVRDWTYGLPKWMWILLSSVVITLDPVLLDL